MNVKPRVVVGSTFTIEGPTFVGTDGETATAPDALPTCSVTRADGTALAAATVAAGDGTGRYVATFAAAHTTRVDELSVVWTATVGGLVQVYPLTVSVVGAHTITLSELRQVSGLEDPGRFPGWFLNEIRDELVDYVEHVLGYPVVPSLGRFTLNGNGRARIPVPTVRGRSVLSVTVDDVAQTVADFTVSDAGVLYRTTGGDFPVGEQNVTVELVHGEPTVTPKLRRELAKAVKLEAVSSRSAISDNVISQVENGVTFRYSTPDPSRGRATGILSLDPVLVELDGKVGVA